MVYYSCCCRYNEVAFYCLNSIDAVTHAVGNTIKRIVLLAVSVVVFNHQMSPMVSYTSFTHLYLSSTTSQLLLSVMGTALPHHSMIIHCASMKCNAVQHHICHCTHVNCSHNHAECSQYLSLYARCSKHCVPSLQPIQVCTLRSYDIYIK